jgi:Family of unknown function (DUF5678)
MTRKDDSYEFFVKSLRRLMVRYEGRYAAIVSGSVVAHGKDAKRVYEIARDKYPLRRVLIGQVPVKGVRVWKFHAGLTEQPRVNSNRTGTRLGL